MISFTDGLQALSDIQGQVRNYKKLSPQKHMFSCTVCGDSRTNQRKARFGVSFVQGSWVCNCFNCGYAAPLELYLEYQFPEISKRLKQESFMDMNLSLDWDKMVETMDDKKLAWLFFINQTPSTQEWINKLKQKKIFLKKESFTKLYNMKRELDNNDQNKKTSEARF